MLWRTVLPYRGSWTGCKNVQAANSLISTKGNEKLSTWEGITPHISMGLTSWKAAWTRKTCWSWWTPSWNEQCTPVPSTASWVTSGELLPVGRERWSFSANIWSVWSSSVLLNTRKICTSRSKSSKGPQGRFKGWQHLTYEEAERAVTVQAREEKIQGES